MVKKISFLIFSVAILVIGVISFNKLSYGDRSTRIFSFSSDAPFEGRMGRGPEGREEFVRPEMRELPDSLRQQFGPQDGERMGRGHDEGGLRNVEDRGRAEFPGGKKINIRNVKWFLAVFALFTVLAIYIDKAYCLIRKRKL
ncbi:MAG: hypothetical protein NTW82_10935 [Bacteroidia bacterium]|nr:hypothetical protein [Bacteroidia bacterium]